MAPGHRRRALRRRHRRRRRVDDHGADGRQQGVGQPAADGQLPRGLHVDGRDRREGGRAASTSRARTRTSSPTSRQRRAAEARAKGKFKDEIVPVTTRVFDEAGKAHDGRPLTEDTILRPDTQLDGLTKLKPAFDAKGTRHRRQRLAADRRRRGRGGDERGEGEGSWA